MVNELVINWENEIEKKKIASIFDLTVCSKTMVMLTGPSRSGKTVTCLNFTNSAIMNKKKVLYLDLDEKSIIKRPEPNFFNMFYLHNKDKYSTYFNYSREAEIEKIFEVINEIKPELIVIDNLYSPFEKTIESGMGRAKSIKIFLSNLRDIIWKNEVGCIITTPMKTMAVQGEIKRVSLGGEGVVFLSDIRISIDFPSQEENMEGWRKFVVDKNLEYEFKIDDMGILRKK